ncbi:hypothetical protein GGD38_005598 [Chitinophagaceae bacterium OAS944]|nr:hypothetical protein [Chitinophagaceae bacterium OAS944]
MYYNVKTQFWLPLYYPNTTLLLPKHYPFTTPGLPLGRTWATLALPLYYLATTFLLPIWVTQGQGKNNELVIQKRQRNEGGWYDGGENRRVVSKHNGLGQCYYGWNYPERGRKAPVFELFLCLEQFFLIILLHNNYQPLPLHPQWKNWVLQYVSANQNKITVLRSQSGR